MKQETIQIRHQNVKPVVTEIPIDPENCPFAVQYIWDDGCFIYYCTLDHKRRCMLCNEGKDCDKLYSLNNEKG